MDVTKVSTALTEAQNALNAVTDEEFKARRIKALRPLTLAAQAIELAQKHIATAVERTTPAAPPAEGAKPAKAAAKAGK